MALVFEAAGEDPGESALIEASRRGDTRAFDALMRRYEDRIFRRAQSVCARLPEEAARRLKLSVPAVKSRLHRGRAMLKKALDSFVRGAASEAAAPRHRALRRPRG